MNAPLICELCALSEFDNVWLPDQFGALVQASGLKVCCGCRAVYFPRSERPVMRLPVRPAGPGESIPTQTSPDPELPPTQSKLSP